MFRFAKNEDVSLLTSCKACPHSGTICGFSPGSLKLKLSGSRHTGQSSSSSSLDDTTGRGAETMLAYGCEGWCDDEACEEAVEYAERSDVDDGTLAGVRAKTERKEEANEGGFGALRGVVYAVGCNLFSSNTGSKGTTLGFVIQPAECAPFIQSCSSWMMFVVDDINSTYRYLIRLFSDLFAQPLSTACRA